MVMGNHEEEMIIERRGWSFLIGLFESVIMLIWTKMRQGIKFVLWSGMNQCCLIILMIAIACRHQPAAVLNILGQHLLENREDM